MRIVLDVQGAQTHSRYRGIGRYSLSLAQAIARNSASHDVWVCTNNAFEETNQAIVQAFEGLVPASRIVGFSAPRNVGWHHPGGEWRRGAAELAREAFIASLRADVVHVSSLFEGSQDDAVHSVGRLCDTPCAVTLYDLIPLEHPERYLVVDWARDWYMDRLENLRRAPLLLAISESARSEGLRLLGEGEREIVNISSAVSDIFRPARLNPAESEALRARFGLKRPFVMYSGAFDERKNVPRLLEAFAALAPEIRSGHQLLLVGKAADSERDALRVMIDRLGLQREVVLAGYVSDADLVALYNEAALFVLPSIHEGFGLPVLEAMACGAAAIGSNATSIPEVIGRTDATFDPYDVAAQSSLMAEVLGNSEFRSALREHALRQSRLFSWDRSARIALDAFEKLDRSASRVRPACGFASRDRGVDEVVKRAAKIPRAVAVTEAELWELAECLDRNRALANEASPPPPLPESLSWRLEGPFDSSYSLALLNRETALALRAHGHDVALHSTEGPGDFAPDEVFLDAHPELRWMHERSQTMPSSAAHVTSRNLYPPRVSGMESSVNVLHHYAWEESGFPAGWVDDFNWYLDGVTCLSRHVRKVLVDNGVAVPLTVSGCGVDHWERVDPAPCTLDAKRFRFLHVSSCFPRKGVDALLVAYGQAFSEADDVTLVIKTFPNPHNELHGWLSSARAGRADFPDVHIIEADLDESALKGLYEACDALVAPSRAEGFGLPLAEAMLSGLPVVTTGWGGQLDFCDEHTAWLIDYRFAPAQSHFDLHGSVWVEPDVSDLARILRVVYDEPESQRRARAHRAREKLLQEFKWSDVAARLEASVRSIACAPSRPVPRVALVSTWHTRCGVATYSEHLVREFRSRPIIMAMQSDSLLIEDSEDIRRCWHAGSDERLEQLSRELELAEVEVVWLQFQYGFFDFPSFASFLEKQKAAGRTLVVTMHATIDPAHVPEKKLSMLVGAFALCDRLLVHSVEDLNRLKQLGLVANVALFPHGVVDHSVAVETNARPEFVLATYGFFLPHKGLPELIQAVSMLIGRGTDVRLKMVNAEYPVAESRNAIVEARQQIARLGIESKLELVTDFLSDEESLQHLAEADLVVFPYQQTGESASGAVRYGLASGRPIAVTPLSIFSDVRSAAFELPGTTPEAIAEGLERVISAIRADSDESREISGRAERWRDSHRYSRLAPRLESMFYQLYHR